MVNPMTEREKFISDIEAFIADTGVAATEFGRLTMNDKKFVGRLRAGSDVRLDTVERVRRFMTDYRARQTHPSRRVEARAVA